jgi:drug/metabolite transporter (DMT)-like permease
MLSVGLALGAALSWGLSDFVGGVTSRRVALLWVLLCTQLVGLVLVSPLALVHGGQVLGPSAAAAAMAGSLAGLLGIAGLYRAIALGVATLAAPISATGAILPVAWGLLRGEPVRLPQEIGAILGLLGIVAASRTGREQAHLGPAATAGIGFALLAALGFGGFFILLHEASTSDVLWAVSLQRLTGSCVLALVLLVRRPAWEPNWRDAPPLLLVGALDQAANGLYGLASTVGLVSLSAVLASLYPVVTIVLARLVLRERVSPIQQTGVALALAGVALVAGAE